MLDLNDPPPSRADRDGQWALISFSRHVDSDQHRPRGHADCCDTRSQGAGGRGQGDTLKRNQPLTFAKRSPPLSVIHGALQMLRTRGTGLVIAWRFNESHAATTPWPSSCRCLRRLLLEEVCHGPAHRCLGGAPLRSLFGSHERLHFVNRLQ
ncbi:unnamed protein product [Arctogadus glacialis]